MFQEMKCIRTCGQLHLHFDPLFMTTNVMCQHVVTVSRGNVSIQFWNMLYNMIRALPWKWKTKSVFIQRRGRIGYLCELLLITVVCKLIWNNNLFGCMYEEMLRKHNWSEYNLTFVLVMLLFEVYLIYFSVEILWDSPQDRLFPLSS